MPSAETGMGGKMITRHNALRDVFSTCQQAAQALVREDRALLSGTEARPADILLPHWTEGSWRLLTSLPPTKATP